VATAMKLSCERLTCCDELVSPCVKQYLEAGTRYVLDGIGRPGMVLEFGCGSGRVTLRLAEAALVAIGIDTAQKPASCTHSDAGRATPDEFRT
jgi:methylase of polypeptide subunit release factors